MILEPFHSFGPVASLCAALLLFAGAALPFGWALRRYLRFTLRVYRARRTSRAAPPLVAGSALVHGVVECEDAEPPFRLLFEQWVMYEDKAQVWRETSCSIQCQPFSLRLSDGTSIGVLPDRRSRLIAALETDRFESAYRVRRAELRAGDQVWVRGELTRDDGTGAWVVRDTAAAPLELCCVPLDAPPAVWRRFYGWLSLALLVLLVCVSAGLSDYVALLMLGKAEVAEVTGHSTFTRSNKGRSSQHYRIHVRVETPNGPLELQPEVRLADHIAASSGQLKTARVIYAMTSPPICMVGSHAALDYSTAFLTLAWLVILALIARLTRDERNIPWYESDVVIERGPRSVEEWAWYPQVPSARGLFHKRLPKVKL